jgi:hypothetical protein
MFTGDTAYSAPLTNLPLNLPAAIKAHLDLQSSEHTYQILDYRFGLTTPKIRTLEEVGSLMRVTRERIRQKETQAILYLKKGLLDIPLIEIGVSLTLLREISALRQILFSVGTYFEEQDFFDFVETRYEYKLKPTDKASLIVLLEVYGFEKLRVDLCRPFWRTAETYFTQDDLSKLSRQCANALHKAILPLSYTDLLLTIAKLDRLRVLNDEVLRFILKSNDAIETLPDDYFQLKFERLRSAGEFAYRLLSERNETPIHNDELAREINSRLVRAGEKSIGKRTIVNAMTQHPNRFAPIGKSGLWGLSEWDMVQSTIVDIMVRCFHEIQKPATSSQIYECVKAYRSDAKPNSISAYLADRDEFVKVGKGLYQLREWKITDELKQGIKLLRQPWSVEQYTTTIISIFDEAGATELPLNDLTQRVMDKTAASNGRVRKVISSSPAIRIEAASKGRQKLAVLVRDFKIKNEPRITLRDRVHSAVREQLLRQPNYELPLITLKTAVMNTTQCPEKTFYQYLGSLDGIIKEKQQGSTRIMVRLNAPTTKTGLTDQHKGKFFDVAISYAGQNGQYATEFVSLLRKAGLYVFFAPHHQAEFAGNYLNDDLIEIYRYQAKRCVIIHSVHYNRSNYTELERKAAIDRKYHEPDENYIILIKLDDAPLKNWLSGDMYYDGRVRSLVDLADIVITAVNRDFYSADSVSP